MLHKIDEFPGQMTFFINFEKFFVQKYALLIFFCGILWVSWDWNTFISENLIFALSNEV